VVIVILGILAATALPKFSDLTVDARIAKMNGMYASLHATAAMLHGQILAEQLAAGSNVTTDNGSNTISMVNYYPAGNASGILAAIDTNGYAISAITTSSVAILPDAGRTNCYITYTEAPTTSGVPSFANTQITGANAVTNCS